MSLKKKNVRSKNAPDPNITYFGIIHGLHIANNEPFLSEINNLLKPNPLILKKNDTRIVKIYCSQLVRTAETALVLFHKIPNLELHIIPYINENRSLIKSVKNKDNEPTTIEEYVRKFETFYNRFKDNNQAIIKIETLGLVFYNKDYEVLNYKFKYNNGNRVTSINEYYSLKVNERSLLSNSNYFVQKPDKQKFIKYSINIKDNSYIVTHSKFLESLDSGYKTESTMTTDKSEKKKFFKWIFL